MKPLSFPAQLDYYLSAVSCRDSLVNSLKDIIRPYKHGNILDCSVGTGFGIIDLIDSGYKITCSDACENMISRFNKNAQTTSVKTSPLKIKWQELGDKLPELFELILCRGNSIVYSDMWDKDNQSANVKEMNDSIKGIFKSIKSGGCLYIDIPSDKYLNYEHPISISHDETEVNCLPVNVRETIIHDKSTKKRKWEVEMTIAGDIYSFTRYSHLIAEEEFKQMLVEAGFKRIARIDASKYREHYCEFIAYK